MYHVSAQGIDERMINVHYYYYNMATVSKRSNLFLFCLEIKLKKT